VSEQDHSGNRWEPTDPEAAPTADAPPHPPSTSPSASAPPPADGTPGPRLRDRVNRTHAGLAGAGALLLLGGGVGGYFVGHATGSSDPARDVPGMRGPGFGGGHQGDGDGRGRFQPPSVGGQGGQDGQDGQAQPDGAAPGTTEGEG
jgi:hypothetical protein